jgi:hypothetical protein
MARYLHIHRAEAAGQRLGGVVRRLMRRNGRVTCLNPAGGGVPCATRVLLWSVGVAIVGLIMIVTFWLALLVGFALAAAKLLQHAARAPEAPVWEPKDPNDHRRNLFYHPLSYNDDPDPRFEDD